MSKKVGKIMQQKVIMFLKSKKRTTVKLNELYGLFSGEVSYNDFANVIQSLEQKGLLRPVKSHYTNNKEIPLYNTYRINKLAFKDQLVDDIQKFKLSSHPLIDLSYYFSSSESQWQKDLPFIKLVNKYFKYSGVPQKEVSAAERSYQITGDEKWIDFKGGKSLLKRLAVYDKLRIVHNADPLMVAVNPKNFTPPYIHLIVENKATFYEFQQFLEESLLTSLIYGSGWKIIGNINLLQKQLSLPDKGHRFYYFGDLDWEGLSIWSGVFAKQKVLPAAGFYQMLLTKPATSGKKNQKQNREALDKFTKHFNKDEAAKIEKLLAGGYYYPQEGLGRDDIVKVMEEMKWI
ncbi:Wadjet anti-phage system protein JetD domain-containing protein [Proteinivorax hydrogeniformans]|uniref:Wadjet anti-phage system protein JetD domain-containing protein n=1 Tax=Proteinivorax hydrogeniformans TaxID=1826727 RepID=A0AAU8HUL0_9FIRM